MQYGVLKMKKIKLYHYSNNRIKNFIKPEFFGKNFYSGYSQKLSQFKRSYFYDKPEPEYLLQGCEFLYITEVKQNRIYDIIKDKLDLQNKFNSLNDILLAIKKKGYIGFLGSVSNKYNVICLFRQIKIKARQTLTKG